LLLRPFQIAPVPEAKARHRFGKRSDVRFYGLDEFALRGHVTPLFQSKVREFGLSASSASRLLRQRCGARGIFAQVMTITAVSSNKFAKSSDSLRVILLGRACVAR